MRIEDQRPARLYQIGGNTCLTIPRSFCRELGLVPRDYVLLYLDDDGNVVIHPRKALTDGKTAVRRPTARPAAGT